MCKLSFITFEIATIGELHVPYIIAWRTVTYMKLCYLICVDIRAELLVKSIIKRGVLCQRTKLH
jgi:hypothetical protein